MILLLLLSRCWDCKCLKLQAIGIFRFLCLQSFPMSCSAPLSWSPWCSTSHTPGSQSGWLVLDLLPTCCSFTCLPTTLVSWVLQALGWHCGWPLPFHWPHLAAGKTQKWMKSLYSQMRNVYAILSENNYLFLGWIYHFHLCCYSYSFLHFSAELLFGFQASIGSWEVNLDFCQFFSPGTLAATQIVSYLLSNVLSSLFCLLLFFLTSSWLLQYCTNPICIKV